MTIPSVNLVALHQAIITGIAAAFPEPAVVLVQDYPRQFDKLAVPAILISLEEIDVLDDPGTDQTALNLRFSAVVVVGNLRKDAANLDPRMSVRVLAVAVAHAVNRQTWGIPGVGMAKVRLVIPDAFDPRLDQYECWRIEWTQEAWVGADLWDVAGIVPSQVWSADTPLGEPLDPQKIVYPMPAP